jgi:CheY-like chemotaxis protein/two-component sensor histidine kinase
MNAIMTHQPECVPEPAVEPSGGESIILVVDDSPIDRRVAGSLIEKHTSWKLRFAGDGREALESIEREQPSAVLTDIRMPVLDGLMLVEEMRVRFPLVPVVLMTSLGSEEIAFQALQKAAASFVPKKNLERDLIETLDQVLAVADRDRRGRQVHECLVQSELHYRMGNNPRLVPSLASLLQDNVRTMLELDVADGIRVGVALEEALLNAICHGNLEVSSELRTFEGEIAYHNLIKLRRFEPPYCDRLIHVRTRATRQEAICTIQDEGHGFDVACLPDPTDPSNLEKPSGRGLLLIRTFMDEVYHNDQGNEITMIKRRRPSTSEPS